MADAAIFPPRKAAGLRKQLPHVWQIDGKPSAPKIQEFPCLGLFSPMSSVWGAPWSVRSAIMRCLLIIFFVFVRGPGCCGDVLWRHHSRGILRWGCTILFWGYALWTSLSTTNIWALVCTVSDNFWTMIKRAPLPWNPVPMFCFVSIGYVFTVESESGIQQRNGF